MSTDVERATLFGMNSMRAAADRRLNGRLIWMRTVIVVLLACTVGLGWLSWPRIEAIYANRAAGDQPVTASPSPAAPSEATSPPSGNALLLTGWTVYSNGTGGAIVGVQMMLRRETQAEPGTAGVWFLYPPGAAPAAATTSVSVEGQDYVAVQVGPLGWSSGTGSLVAQADLTCGQGMPVLCSGTLTLDAPQTSVTQSTPAVVINAIDDGSGLLRVLSTATLTAAPEVSWCQIMPCD